MEKRNHQRISIKNLSVDASDGFGFFHGSISDASRFGIRVTDLQKKLEGRVKKNGCCYQWSGLPFQI